MNTVQSATGKLYTPHVTWVGKNLLDLDDNTELKYRCSSAKWFELWPRNKGGSGSMFDTQWLGLFTFNF